MASPFVEQEGWSVLPTLYLRTVPTKIGDLVIEMRRVHADFDLGLWPTVDLAVAHVKTLLTQNRRNAELWLEALPEEIDGPGSAETLAAGVAHCREEVQLALRIAAEGLRVIEEWEKKRRPRG